MIEILARWNRWGSATLNAGIERAITSHLMPFLNTPEVVTLIGPRRAGKTTVLFQLMDKLEKLGIPKEAMLHINLEEPGLSPDLSIDLLESLYRTYREELYPEGKAYLFLDEIQNVPNWERWVRARNDTENIKFFITGSSSQLMSRELGTLLTGRHVSFKVYPLNFKEFLEFKSISLPSTRAKTLPSPKIQHALNSYLKWGGFPEVVLATNKERKELLLKQYFDDVLFKDIVVRHKIRDVFCLRNLAIFLLTQTGSLISFQRIAKIFNVSLDLAQAYCNYLQEAFLVDFVTFYSNKASERNRNPHKVYAVDLGLRHVVNLAHSRDNGHLVETTVYHALLQQPQDGIFYWKQQQEVDFILRQGNTIKTIVQAVSALDSEQTIKRELGGLAEAVKKFSQASQLIVTGKMPILSLKQENINLIPLWNFLTTPSHR